MIYSQNKSNRASSASIGATTAIMPCCTSNRARRVFTPSPIKASSRNATTTPKPSSPSGTTTSFGASAAETSSSNASNRANCRSSTSSSARHYADKRSELLRSLKAPTTSCSGEKLGSGAITSPNHNSIASSIPPLHGFHPIERGDGSPPRPASSI